MLRLQWTFLAVALLAVGVLSGCESGSRAPDPGTHISPVQYRARANAWCKKFTPRARTTEKAFQRAVESHDRRRILAAFAPFTRMIVAFQAHFLSTPVPAGLKNTMGPVLELMAASQPSLQLAVTASRQADGGQLVASYRGTSTAVHREFDRLRLANLNVCARL
jgi:hypothetical protein